MSTNPQSEIHQQSADGDLAELPPFDLKKSIDAFNHMYKLPVGTIPGFWYIKPPEEVNGKEPPEQVFKRITDFRHTLQKEIDEADELLVNIQNGSKPSEVLTELADWLGDICIYCVSEMRKHGLDPNMVFSIIMASNASKLGPDGQPIYDDKGKVLKGPNYWKPEPMLKQYIQIEMRRAARRQALQEHVEQQIAANAAAGNQS